MKERQPATAGTVLAQRMREDPELAERIYRRNPHLRPAPRQPSPVKRADAAPTLFVAGLVIDLTLPIRLHSITNLTAWKVKSRLAQQQRGTVRDFLAPAAPLLQNALPLTVRLTRIAPRVFDNDNLQASGKHVRDALAALMGVDDRDPRVTWETVRQRKGRPGEYATRIQISQTPQPSEDAHG